MQTYIYSRLVRFSKEGEPIDGRLFSMHARYIFDKKKDILIQMHELDPAGNWTEVGAKYIKNFQSGDEYTLRRLDEILTSLENEGQNGFGFKLLYNRRMASLFGRSVR